MLMIFTMLKPIVKINIPQLHVSMVLKGSVVRRGFYVSKNQLKLQCVPHFLLSRRY